MFFFLLNALRNPSALWRRFPPSLSPHSRIPRQKTSALLKGAKDFDVGTQVRIALPNFGMFKHLVEKPIPSTVVKDQCGTSFKINMSTLNTTANLWFDVLLTPPEHAMGIYNVIGPYGIIELGEPATIKKGVWGRDMMNCERALESTEEGREPSGRAGHSTPHRHGQQAFHDSFENPTKKGPLPRGCNQSFNAFLRRVGRKSMVSMLSRHAHSNATCASLCGGMMVRSKAEPSH